MNQLVHLCGLGQFKLLQVNAAPEPCPAHNNHNSSNSNNSHASQQMQTGDDSSMQDDHSASSSSASAKADQLQLGPEVLAVANPELQESLLLEAQVDTLAGEQTWPTDQEVSLAYITHALSIISMFRQQLHRIQRSRPPLSSLRNTRRACDDCSSNTIYSPEQLLRC